VPSGEQRYVVLHGVLWVSFLFIAGKLLFCQKGPLTPFLTIHYLLKTEVLTVSTCFHLHTISTYLKPIQLMLCHFVVNCIEAILRMIALGYKYFTQFWNL